MTTISQQITELIVQQQQLEIKVDLLVKTQTEIINQVKQINDYIIQIKIDGSTSSKHQKVTIRRPRKDKDPI